MGFSDFMAEAERSFRGTAAALDQFGQQTLAPTIAKTWDEMDRFGKEQLGPAMARVGEGMDQFGKEQLGPAMQKTAEELDRFGKEQLGPAMARVGEGMDQFRKEQLGLAMQKTAEELDRFGKEQLEPAITRVGEDLGYFKQHKIGPALHTAFQATSNLACYKLGPAVSNLVQHKLLPIAENFVLKPIKENPAAVATVASSSVIACCPWLITAPFLMVLGFTPIGPASASIAAIAQSSIGNVPAGSLLAILQSAAMGGYGVLTMNAVVSGTAAAVAAAVSLDISKKQVKEKNKEKQKYLIDKTTLEIKQDEEGTVYKDLESIGDDLPDHSPRFILLSYPCTLPSGRLSVPYVLVFYLPPTVNAEQRMLYAGAKELMRNTAEVGRVLEIESVEDLEEIPDKLKGDER
ncbi:hypothetical protein DSL72_005892 [Monilinia vaccinii-corymbosi]|uniref:ADF-H domain-containing protein n=1 Tax=Monilinia vaccinii-corymbosi TaxID=61207 RepID=A0A8A3PGB0_9HELO|nr:hypothetical protein DSL72_005892 [Monilinia vaccinii-corymbosi]